MGAGIPDGYNTIPHSQWLQAIIAGAKTLGNVFYVHSTDGTDAAGYGSLPESPVASIDYANGLCTASNGDIIIVLPGHSETITGTDITMDTAGVSVYGMGSGSLMPQIKHNHADAEVSIAADNVTWANVKHTSTVTGVKCAIEIEDGIDYCIVRGCVFDVETTTEDEFLVSVRTNDASNFATIEGCEFDMGLGGAVSAVSFTKDTNGTKVIDNVIQGDYSTACINGITTKSTKLLIKGNILVNGATDGLGTEPAIDLVTASSGVIAENYIVCNLSAKADAIDADACMLFENYYNEDISSAGTGGLIGTASDDDT